MSAAWKPIPGLTSNDTCPGCGGCYFWGVVEHYDGCPTPDLYAHPANLARRDQLMAAMRDFITDAS